MKLHEIAHDRAGGKGDTSNISVIAYRSGDWPRIEAEVTAEKVAAHFDRKVSVTRHVLPGGVTRSLALDAHGKALAFAVLDFAISGPLAESVTATGLAWFEPACLLPVPVS